MSNWDVVGSRTELSGEKRERLEKLWGQMIGTENIGRRINTNISENYVKVSENVIRRRRNFNKK